METASNKIIVILGPTSAGKTGLAVKLAYRYNGEIVSADSRQVYKGMDIGTGKDLKEYEIKVKSLLSTEVGKSLVRRRGGKVHKVKIPHHLIDVVSPKAEFNLAKYQKLAYKAIDDILERGKLPIIVGGTGLYLQSVVDDYKLSEVKPDKKIRSELEKLNKDELIIKLAKINPKLVDRLNESDIKNKRRLIRYLEILSQSANTENLTNTKSKAKIPWIKLQDKQKPKYNSLIIGINKPKEELNEKIYNRIIERLEREDMAGEVKRLHEEGISWKRLESFGLEYKFIAYYLQDKLNYDEMVEKLYIASKQFAKRQMTWFRRWEKQGTKINWIKNKTELKKIITRFFRNLK